MFQPLAGFSNYGIDPLRTSDLIYGRGQCAYSAPKSSNFWRENMGMIPGHGAVIVLRVRSALARREISASNFLPIPQVP